MSLLPVQFRDPPGHEFAPLGPPLTAEQRAKRAAAQPLTIGVDFGAGDDWGSGWPESSPYVKELLAQEQLNAAMREQLTGITDVMGGVIAGGNMTATEVALRQAVLTGPTRAQALEAAFTDALKAVQRGIEHEYAQSWNTLFANQDPFR